MSLLPPTLTAGWEWQHSFPQGNQLNDVHVFGDDKAIAVGDFGTLLETNDGGQTWMSTFALNGVESNFSSLEFIGEQGWVAGGGGTILRTSDGGESWFRQVSGTSEILNRVFFVDSSHGWAVGENGTLLRTTNAGGLWTTHDVGTSRVLNSVHFVDHFTGWCVGAQGFIAQTTDGGLTWSAATSFTTESVLSVFFFDKLNGWMGARDIFRTTNGGVTWTDTNDPDLTGSVTDIYFHGSAPGWALVDRQGRGSVLKSVDGWNWVGEFSPLQQGLSGIHFADVEVGWVVGPDGAIYRSEDGGKSWETQFRNYVHPPILDPDFKSVFFVDSLQGWGVGHSETVYVTRDGGVTWAKQNGWFDRTNWYSLFFLNEDIGFVVGSDGRILRTSNSGGTWTEEGSGTREALNSVTFIDASNGWIAGSGGMILHTTDLGERWVKITSGTATALHSIFFLDGTFGWAVGDDGILLRTTNGGRDWVFQWTGTGYALRDVFFVGLNGLAVGDEGTLFQSTDGGLTWENRTGLTTADLKSVVFATSESGWITGENGTILYTSDGGTVWEEQTPVTNRTLTSIHMINSVEGWVVGDKGTVLHTIDGGGGTVPPPADPLAMYGICYATTGNGEPNYPGALISIDPLTGVGTLIGSTGIVGDNGPAVPALAIRSTGEIYGTSQTVSNAGLYQIDASTGAGTFVANTGLVAPYAMTFDEDDVLYAVDANYNMHTVDENTGTSTLIGQVGFQVRGLASDPIGGTLYASTRNDQLITVNKTTGAGTFVGTSGLGGNIQDIHFDQSGNLYGSIDIGNPTFDYISIDKSTGAGTVIGPIGFDAVVGMATRLETPVPGTITVNVQIDSLLQVVPADGDTFAYTITLTNTGGTELSADWWTKVIRPFGDPIDPLSGPNEITLSPFETVVIDTPLLQVPYNSFAGDYSLIAYVGEYPGDTDSDTTFFTKLEGIPCADIDQF